MNVVVHCHEHLRDGHDYWARIFPSTELAIAYIDSVTIPNVKFLLFHLGAEIPITFDEILETVVPNRKRKARVQ